MAEGLLLVLLGAGVGLLLSYWGLKLILAAAPDSLPRTAEIGLNLPVLLFTLGLSVLIVFIFALAPMAQIGERSLTEWLRGAGLRTTGGTSGQGIRTTMVISQIALAVVLVVGSGLMIRTFWKLQQVEMGFNPNGVLSFGLEVSATKYPNAERLRFATALQERLAGLPGVKSAAAVDGLPPLRPVNANDTGIEGYQRTPDGPVENVDYWNVVSEDYFKVMNIRLQEGRTFEQSDRGENAQRVAVINRALAHRFWQDSPLGKRVNPGSRATPNWFTIVGVVDDAKNAGVDKPAGPELYFLNQQVAQIGLDNVMNFVIRTDGEPKQLASTVRQTVHDLDQGVPVYEVQTMTDMVADSMVRPRFLSMLLTMFSATALLLAAVGIYGVMSYLVAQRTREIGIRLALGAQRFDMVRLVLGQGLPPVLLGIGIGLVGAYGLTKLLSGLLYGVTTSDPLTYIGVIVTLAAVAVVAGYVPARRATRVDPMTALRYE